MLRNSFIKSVLNENNSINENKYFDEDENYLLFANRPLSEKSIMDLPLNKLDKFVDRILTNKSVSKTLFSSTAGLEINMLKKTNEKIMKSKNENKKTIQENNPNDIVINRKRNEMIEDIKLDIEQYKQSQILDLQQVKNLNLEYRKFFKDQNLKEQQDSILNMNEVRIKRFEKIFNSIKDKLQEKLKNGKRQGFIFGDVPFELKEIKMPEIKLNLHEVFSRLFYNEVLFDPKKCVNFDNNRKNNIPEANNSVQMIKSNNHEHNFVVKNVIENSNRKEFTIKITDDIFAKCFSKYTGEKQVNYHKVNLLF